MDGTLIRHKELSSSGRWAEMSLAQQLANVGSEVFRATKWKKAGKTERASNAAERAIELLDLTVRARQEAGLDTREVLRLREYFCDYFYGFHEYGASSASINRYFDPFSMKAAAERAQSGRENR